MRILTRLSRVLLGLSLLVSAAAPIFALAHGLLKASSPANGARLQDAPAEIRLVFSEQVEIPFVRVALHGPAGTVALAPPMLVRDSPNTVVTAIREPLHAGSYTVRWQAAGADGHPVRDTLVFRVDDGAAGLSAEPPPQAPAVRQPVVAEPAHHASEMFPPSSGGFDVNSPAYVIVRWINFLGLVALIGAVVFRLVVLPRTARQELRGGPSLARAAGRGVERLAFFAAVTVMVGAVLRLLAHAYVVGGDQMADAARMSAILRGTTWGAGWILQVLAGLAALAGLIAVARRRRGWAVVAVAALALAFTPGLSGHAAALPTKAGLAMVADALHVVAAGGWVGSLFALMIAGLPAARWLSRPERAGGTASLVRAFSPTALVFAGMLVLSGVFSTVLHLGSVPALWQTAYGRTLLIKIALLLIVFGTGAFNFRRVVPRLGSDATTGVLRRSAAIELTTAAVVLLVTAVLVATPPSQDAAAAITVAP